jgi:pimeloyl-ACP methyl ester carboxylesterase
VASLDVGDALISYEARGDGPVVICAHGFPDCPRSFREQVPALVAAGFRAVTLSMRAYAPSSPSRSGRYDAAALGGDLLALADALSPDAPVSLVGHDWGAVAAYAAAALAPARIHRLVTAAVPHLRVAGARWLRPSQLRRSWYMGFFQLRGLSERRLAADDMALVERLWRDWSPGYACPVDEMEAVKRALAPHLPDVLGYYRAVLSFDGRARRALLARTQVPALYVHGVDDGCVGVELADGVESAYAGPVELQRIAHAGHFVHLEQPRAFNEAMLRHLGS